MKVKIYRYSDPVTQSGLKKTKLWLIETVPDHKFRSIDPLMGWTSSDETRTQIKLKFKSKEEAIKYAKDQGFEYEVLEPQIGSIKKKSYAENFS